MSITPKKTIKEIVTCLVEEDYEKTYKNDFGKRLNSEEIKEGIEDYPGHISVFPESAFDFMRVYKRSETEYSLDFPLWYNNERSDLTLVCNVRYIEGKIRYSIQDILVQ